MRAAEIDCSADSASKTLARRFQSRKFGALVALTIPGRGASQTPTMRSGSANGRGLSRTASTTLNMATLAPIPRASTPTTTALKPGERRTEASPCRKSLSSVSIHRKLRSSRCSSFTCSIPPKLRRAVRRASSGDMPRATASLSANSRWARISSSNSQSRRRLRVNATRRPTPRLRVMTTPPESEPPGPWPSPSSPPRREAVSARPRLTNRTSPSGWSPKCPNSCEPSLPAECG